MTQITPTQIALRLHVNDYERLAKHTHSDTLYYDVTVQAINGYTHTTTFSKKDPLLEDTVVLEMNASPPFYDIDFANLATGAASSSIALRNNVDLRVESYVLTSTGHRLQTGRYEQNQVIIQNPNERIALPPLPTIETIEVSHTFTETNQFVVRLIPAIDPALIKQHILNESYMIRLYDNANNELAKHDHWCESVDLSALRLDQKTTLHVPITTQGTPVYAIVQIQYILVPGASPVIGTERLATTEVRTIVLN